MLGETVIVDNRPGQGGSMALAQLATSTPDGHTMVLAPLASLVVNPHLYRTVGYDSLKDFAPVALIGDLPILMVVNPELPIHNVAELVAYAKAHPGKLNYGAPTGALPHLTGEMFKTAAGVDIVHIPYKGAANGITDLLAGQVDLTFEPISVLVGHIRDGSLRALAVTGETRSAELPDLPTMIESGYPSVVSVSWSGVVAPAGTPDTVVTRLNAAVNAGLGTPQMQAALARLGAAPRPGTPAEFAAFIAAETPKWAAVVKAAHISVE